MKQWNDVPEIEALSETSWRRIERDVFAELDRNPVLVTPAPETPHWLQRWRRPLIGLGIGLAAAAALILALRGAPGDGMQPSRIVTNEAPVALTVGRAAIRVAPESIVWVQSNLDHEVMVMLEAGRVDCRVAHDEQQPPLVVQAGDVRVEVVGTSFAVMRHGSSAAVEVHEGVVKVFHDGRRVLVGAGERWDSGDADRAVAAAAVGGTGPASDSATGEQPADSATGAQATDSATGEQAADGATAEQATGSTSGAQAEHAPQAGHAPKAGQAPKAGHGATAGAEARPERPTAPTPSTGADSAATGASAREADPKQLYEKAARLEATEPLAAIAIYRELARGKSAWAANALFAQARLELDRGNRPEAMRLLRAYLQRHPGGNNAVDARALLDTAD